MAQQALEAREFWVHPYVSMLPTDGKLALYYALCFEQDNQPILCEDMALATGLPIRACAMWLEKFSADGVLEMEGVS